MSKSMRKKLTLSGIALAFGAVLLTILFLRREYLTPEEREPIHHFNDEIREQEVEVLAPAEHKPIRIPHIWLPPGFEAEVQAALLDCANASGEEYIALRDALIPKARAKPEAFRFAAALSPSWEQRLAGEIIMDYALREDGVKAFIEWKWKPREYNMREVSWTVPWLDAGRDYATSARGAPMVLAESIFKGTNDKSLYPESKYDLISENKVTASLALGNLREHRARELLEWLLFTIPDKLPRGMPTTEGMFIAKALGEIGSPESVPVLLLAYEKDLIWPDPLWRCVDESSLPALRDAANNSTNKNVVSVARDLIATILEARQGE